MSRINFTLYMSSTNFTVEPKGKMYTSKKFKDNRFRKEYFN